MRTTTQLQLEVMRRDLATLPAEDQAKIEALVAEVKAFVAKHGALAVIAIGVASLELSLELTQERTPE
ncbi:MAG: hypothetical protein P1V51_19755 [Deltaproteobacteria bacterium]|nr:hypothetical protein [Deltaproteobacteria bacterium]